MEDLEGLDFNVNISSTNKNSSESAELGGESGNWDSWGAETEETKGKKILSNKHNMYFPAL